MPSISEQPVSPDTMLSIKKHAKIASKVLGIEARSSTPSVITSSVDEFVNRWQQGHRPDPAILSPDDAPLIIGSLWGEAIVSRFGWNWVILTFHEPQKITVPAVVSADRSSAIFPLDYLNECFSDASKDVNVSRLYDLLKSGIDSESELGAYQNLMESVLQVKFRADFSPPLKPAAG